MRTVGTIALGGLVLLFLVAGFLWRMSAASVRWFDLHVIFHGDRAAYDRDRAGYGR